MTPSYESRKLDVSREESFTCRFEYIDVVRHTQTNLDRLQENTIDDYWNVDGE